MPVPLDLTFAVLRGQPGSEVCDLCILALDETNPEIQSRCAALLVEQAHPEGLSLLRHRFRELSVPAREILRQDSGPFLRTCLESLKAPDETERLEAVACLAFLGARGEVLSALGEALSDPSETVRIQAAHALVAFARETASLRAHSGHDMPPDDLLIRRRQVAEVLHVALRNYRQHGQIAVLEAVLMLDPGSHKLLLDILANPGDARRPDLQRCVEETEEPEIVPLLIKMSRDPRERLREDAAKLLERRRSDPAFHQALNRFFETAPAKYLQRLATETQTLPWWPSDVSAVPLALQHHLVAFLRLADKLPVTGRVARLTELLKLPDPGVRAQATLLLAEQAEPAAAAVLWSVLDDTEEAVQAVAVRALASSQHPQRDHILTAKLNHPFPSVSAIAREAISHRGFHHYLGAFSKMDSPTRTAAGQALTKLDPQLLKRLEEEMDAQEPLRRLRALQVLDTLDRGNELMPSLARLMGDPDIKVRSSAARSLGHVGNLEALRLLVRGLTDPDRRVRANAIEALGRSGDRRLGSLLFPFLKHEDHRSRANAVKVLWQMGFTEAAVHLEVMLGSPSEAMRISGLWVLAQIPSWPDTTSCLSRLAGNDPSQRVRARAQKLLSRTETP
jgi:HEAT repeat protein